MTITDEQKVQVAKDRAADELAELVGDGYWHCDDEDKARVGRIGSLLAAPDAEPATLRLADELGFLNGEESIFFEKGQS